VRPALEILTRELVSREQISNLSGSLAEQDQDLDMLLSVSSSDTSAEDGGGDELKAVLRAAVEHIQGGLAAIIVPEKGLVLVHRDPNHEIEASLVARAHRHLVSTAQLRSEAVIVKCPVLRSDGNTMGVLALFRTESAPEFTPHYARLTELLASRVATIIGHSYDALTSLLTRPAFEQRVGSVLQESPGNATQRCWSALSIDINRMHVINDNYGMHMGDRVIAQLGELIRTRLPPGAIAARISGDRFAILLPAALEDAAKFAEALRAGAEDLGAVFGDGKMPVSVSIGVSAVDPRSKEFVHAFAAAETACKAANDRGRNRVEVYQEADESIVRRFTDINLIADLRVAIAEDRLELNAQLIVPLGKHEGRRISRSCCA
jgi:diguanylate cyclase (GGDEF)-like protein